VGPGRKVEPADPIEPGLHLVIGRLGKILRSAPIGNAPRRHLQPPFLGPRTLKEIEKPISELVLEFLRRDGRVLDSFGWPWTSEAFYDRPLSTALAREGVRIGRLESRQPLRVLRVPVPPSAAFLLFSQSVVTIGPGLERKTFIRKGLRLYSLPPSDLPRPPLEDFAQHLGVDPLPGTATPVRPR
jgi:hypothetical protein